MLITTLSFRIWHLRAYSYYFSHGMLTLVLGLSALISNCRDLRFFFKAVGLKSCPKPGMLAMSGETNRRVLLASSGKKPRMRPCTLQCTRQSSPTKGLLLAHSGRSRATLQVCLWMLSCAMWLSSDTFAVSEFGATGKQCLLLFQALPVKAQKS